MARPRIGIFVATMTGTAGLCADEVAAALSSLGFMAEAQMMDGLAGDSLAPFDLLVVISSTYGHGDIPDNGQALYAAIEHGPSLAGKSFAVFGLGDRTYATTFCEAGRKWDSLLAAKGAVRFAPLVQHDAAGGALAEDLAGEWASAWAAQLRRAA